MKFKIIQSLKFNCLVGCSVLSALVSQLCQAQLSPARSIGTTISNGYSYERLLPNNFGRSYCDNYLQFINKDGVIAGNISIGDYEDSAFNGTYVYFNGELQLINLSRHINEGISCQVMGLSPHGAKVLVRCFTYPQTVVVYDALADSTNELQGLGSIAVIGKGFTSNQEFVGYGDAGAYLRQGNQLVPLNIYPNLINESLKVISWGFGGTQPTMYDHRTREYKNLVGAQNHARPQAFNDAGVVVGTVNNGSDRAFGYLLGSGMVDLGAGKALGINNGGIIVGTNDSGEAVAFAAGGPQKLEPLVTDLPARTTLVEGLAIGDGGKILVNASIDNVGFECAILSPRPSVFTSGEN